MPQTRYNDAGISPRTTVYAERKMLKHAGPVMVLDKFAMTKPMPKNKSTTIKFRRPKTFTAATTPLVEGVTPASTQFSYEDVEVTLKQYGEVVEITDVIEDTHEDPVLNDAAEQCGENIGRTSEALDFGVLKAGTNVFYSNGSSRAAVNQKITKEKIRAAVRFMMAQKAMRYTKMLDGSQNYNTQPIEASWIAFGHTDLDADIRNLDGFVPVAKYGSRMPVSEHECGSFENVRFVLSPDLAPFQDAGGTPTPSSGNVVSTGNTKADVYPLLICGKESYGKVPLRGQGSISPSIIPAGKREKSDPLGQRGIVAWKMWHAALILNQSWMTRIECAVSEL